MLRTSLRPLTLLANSRRKEPAMSYTKIRICNICKKEDIIRKDNKSATCKKCSLDIKREKSIKTIKSKVKFTQCKTCGKNIPLSKNQTYCSKECHTEDKKEKRECRYCSKEFSIYTSSLNTNTSGNYCNRDCYSKSLKEITGSSHRDYKRIIKHCKCCDNEIKVIKAREHTHNYCSLKCRDKDRIGKFIEENNPNWRGGHKKRKGNFEQVKRKNFNGINFCSLCGTFKKIHIHHIVPFRYTQDNSLSNLISLCCSCHRKVESVTWKVIDSGIDMKTLKYIMSSTLREKQMITYIKIKKLLQTIKGL